MSIPSDRLVWYQKKGCAVSQILYALRHFHHLSERPTPRERASNAAPVYTALQPRRFTPNRCLHRSA